MARYIDADALREELNNHVDYKGGLNYEWESVIANFPTADVVEVVLCKDCKYAKIADREDDQDGYTCQFHRGSIWFSGSYCSWGERKDG